MRSLIFIVFLLFTYLIQAEVTPQQIVTAAKENVSKVPEFAYIQKAAEEIGIKVYLFGGSAAAFAHYIRWYIELQNGAENHQPERFDFDYTNIYRGNQDLDLVVDGTEKQAQKFQKILQEKYSHIVGDKRDWEVRLLREQMGDKLPLLDDPDFKNQHTDTNSTGMLDLTSQKDGLIFRDLLDWENPESKFLKDVAAARITYLFNVNHEDTTRFKEGQNPPLFSAIRYLAKLTQYEVTGTEEDLDIIKKIIQDTKFEDFSRYVQKKLEEFALKTLLNSPSSEYAWNLLEDIGLRKKLIEMDGQQLQKPGSLSWWLNKEPLRKKDFAVEGRTAQEIFGSRRIIVSHETNSFQAYENITRSSRGEANAFISRQGVNGEAAVYGDGFYTRLGDQGARGTGLTIRFKLNPDAREGEDFFLHAFEQNNQNSAFVIVNNKNALTLIQENINLTLTEFLKLVSTGDIGPHDRGLLEKFKRKFNRIEIGSSEFMEAKAFAQDYFVMPEDFPDHLRFVSTQELSFNHLWTLMTKAKDEYFFGTILPYLKTLSTEELLEKKHWLIDLLQKGALDKELIGQKFSQKGWENEDELISLLLQKGLHGKEIISHLLSKEHWSHRTDLVEHFLQDPAMHEHLAMHVLSKSFWGTRPEWFETILKSGLANNNLAQYVLSQKHWSDYPQFVKSLVEIGDADSPLLEHTLSKEHWISHPQFSKFINILIRKKDNHYEITKNILSQPFSAKHPEWYEAIAKKANGDYNLLKYALSQKHWSHKPEWVEEFVFKYRHQRELYSDVLSQEYWQHRTDWVEALMEDEAKIPHLIEHVFSKGSVKYHTKFIEKLISEGQHDQIILQHVLSNKIWHHRTDWIEHFIQKGKSELTNARDVGLHRVLAIYVFSQGDWSHSPHYIEQLIEAGKSFHEITYHILSQEYWAKHPHLVEMLLDKGYYGAVAAHLLVQPHWGTPMKWVKRIQENYDTFDLLNAINKEHWSVHAPKIFEWYIDQGKSSRPMIDMLRDKKWNKHTHLYEKLFDHLSGIDTEYALRMWYRQEEGRHGSDKLLERIALKRPGLHHEIAYLALDKEFRVSLVNVVKIILNKNQERGRDTLFEILSRKPWANYPDLIEKTIKNADFETLIQINKSIFSSEPWIHKHPYLLFQAAEKGVSYPFDFFGLFSDKPRLPNALSKKEKKRFNEALKGFIENNDLWKNHPAIIKYLDGKEVTLKNIQNSILEKGIPRASDFTLRQNLTCSIIL